MLEIVGFPPEGTAAIFSRAAFWTAGMVSARGVQRAVQSVLKHAMCPVMQSSLPHFDMFTKMLLPLLL